MDKGTFRFLHVSSCFPRKGMQAIPQAWDRVFTRHDNVILIIKTFNDPRNGIDAWLAYTQVQFADYPKVEIIKEDMSASQLKGLYESYDVLVTPGCVEGSGLSIAEVMLSGLLAIVTSWSNQLDFVNSQSLWPVDYQSIRVKTRFSLFALTWTSVDINNLVDALKAAASMDKSVLRDMANAGHELILQQLTWKAVAGRSHQAVKTLCAHIDVAQHWARISWLTTWNTRCGIVTYFRHLLESAPHDADVVFAPQASAGGLACADEELVLRNWIVDKENNYPENPQPQIDAPRLDVVVIQFNYGFLNHHKLSAFIRRQHDASRAVAIAMHSAVGPLEKESTQNFRLTEMTDVLALCDRLLVYPIVDVNHLKDLGLTDNVVLSPYGVINYAVGSAARQQQALPLIASYDFCLPHKGLMESVKSVHRLKQAGKLVHSCLVNTEYPVGEPRDLVVELKAAAQQLDVNDLIETHSDLLPDAESLRLLSEADLLIFAYQNTGEPASGAVRYDIATQRPVAVTSLAIFDDLDDTVFKFDGYSIDDISQRTGRILCSIREQDAWATRTQQRADVWRKRHDYYAVLRRLVNMRQGSAKVKCFRQKCSPLYLLPLSTRGAR